MYCQFIVAAHVYSISKHKKRGKNRQLLVTFLCILIWFQKAGSHVCFKEKKLFTYIFMPSPPVSFFKIFVCIQEWGVGVDAIFTFLLWIEILEYHGLLL